jgi:hypothetical protein
MCNENVKVRRSDIALYGRALSEHWPMPAELRKAVIAELVGIALSAASSRTRLTAIKVILQADRQNLEHARFALDEQCDEDPRKLNELWQEVDGRGKIP